MLKKLSAVSQTRVIDSVISKKKGMDNQFLLSYKRRKLVINVMLSFYDDKNYLKQVFFLKSGIGILLKRVFYKYRFLLGQTCLFFITS